MAGIQIDWSGLEHSFENHAPDVRSYLDRVSGEVVTLSDAHEDDPALLQIQARPDQFLFIEPIPSREQYRMMEEFIETVPEGPLRALLSDAIVGKGAFRRFKDAVGRYPDERKRWFAFRDILLRQFILDWIKGNHIKLASMPDWNLELPEAEVSVAREVESSIEGAAVIKHEDADKVREYLQAWARAHGAEYRYIFGPAAFDRLGEDLANEFLVSSRER